MAVKTALDRYPKIKLIAPVECAGESSRHIVRLLGFDAANPASRNALELIEHYADAAPEMTKELLQASFRMELLQRLTEILAFHYFVVHAETRADFLSNPIDQCTVVHCRHPTSRKSRTAYSFGPGLSFCDPTPIIPK